MTGVSRAVLTHLLEGGLLTPCPLPTPRANNSEQKALEYSKVLVILTGSGEGKEAGTGVGQCSWNIGICLST